MNSEREGEVFLITKNNAFPTIEEKRGYHDNYMFIIFTFKERAAHP